MVEENYFAILFLREVGTFTSLEQQVLLSNAKPFMGTDSYFFTDALGFNKTEDMARRIKIMAP